MQTKLIGISGSLRKGSYNTALLHILQELLPDSAQMDIVAIDAFPLFNSDIETPAVIEAAREQIAQAHGVVLTSPEYNYSISGVLKNALDWLSRPAYASVFAHKPVTFLGASLGGVGTARAQAHLREILGGMISQIFPHPEVLVGGARDKIVEGKMVDESTQAFLQKYIDNFVKFVQRYQPEG